MISHAASLLPASPRATMRRGGPFLFKTIWPEVRATLAEASGLEELGARTGPAEADESPPPPYSRAA